MTAAPHGLARHVVLAVALAVYVAGVAFVAARHEPWRDEAGAWLVARDASPAELFFLTRYVGTPALSYLVHMPLAKAGLPYASAKVVHVATAAAAVAVLLWAAPLPLVTRLAVAFSYPVAYEFGVLVRPYALLMLVLFAVAALWPARARRPLAFAALVALLMNVTVHGLILGLAIGAVALHDALLGDARPWPPRRGPALALAIMGAGVLLALAQLVPVGATTIPTWLAPVNPRAAHRVFGELWGAPGGSRQPRWAGIDLGLPRGPGDWAALDRTGVPLYLAVGTVVLTSVSWWRRRRILAIFAAGTAGLLYVYVFKWYGGVRHAGMLFLLLVFCLWIEAGEPAPSPSPRLRRAARILLHAGLLVSLAFSVAAASWDARYPYSHGLGMARYLLAHGLAGREIGADGASASVLVHLPAGTRFWYLDKGAYGTHHEWEPRRRGRDTVLLRRAELELFARATRGELLVLYWPLPDAVQRGYALLYALDGPVGLSDERFYLYRPIAPGS